MLSSSSTTRMVCGISPIGGRESSCTKPIRYESDSEKDLSVNIAGVRPVVAGGQREGYAAAVTGLWNRLARALSALEAIAADPDELLDDDTLERLPSLQYALHA